MQKEEWWCLEQPGWARGPKNPCESERFKVWRVRMESEVKSDPRPQQLGTSLAPPDSLCPVWRVIVESENGGE